MPKRQNYQKYKIMIGYKIEYVWIDGTTPTPLLRSKTRVVYNGAPTKVEEVDNWSFDASKTCQSTQKPTDLILKPVRLIGDPVKANGYIVMCEVLNLDYTPHETNIRSRLLDDDTGIWLGFGQEYFLIAGHVPAGWPGKGEPGIPKSRYYCGVGKSRVNGRHIVEKHMEICIAAGLQITGMNAGATLGQWKFQILAHNYIQACDDLWLARFLLERTAEQHGMDISYNYNECSLCTNFSTTYTRGYGIDDDMLLDIFHSMKESHHEDINQYGVNEKTEPEKFSMAGSGFAASCRVPIENEIPTYLEDRRGVATADPYRIAKIIKKHTDTWA